MRRLITLIAGTLVLAPAHASAASVPADKGVVLDGVTVAGVDLSGLTLPAAQAKLETDLAPHVSRDLLVRIAGRKLTLTSAEAKLTLDAETSAKRAIRTKVAGEVPVKLTYSAQAVKAWVAAEAAKIDRPGRDSRLVITLKKVRATKSKPGVSVPQADIAKKLGERLLTPGSSALLNFKVKSVRAAVTADDLRKQNGGTVLTVDKKNFKLRLFKHLKYVRSFGVAVGQPAYPTPSGRFRIVNKQVNPTWSVPNSPWAGELQGTTVAGGSPNNPLKARWMGIINGVGIHGTGQEYSIGSRASHGCIRMRVADVIKLYKRVPVGTPILIQ